MKRLFFKKQTPAVYEEIQVKERPLPSLAMCILMDFLGYASYGIPILGEFLDIIWAPISAIIFFKMFGGKKGFFGGIFSFFEELMPGLDFIPTFTITWLIQYSKRKKQTYTVRTVR